ncbi:hypothetical protein [Enterobacter phage vB_ExiM_F5M1E]|nr:hypothetical protein [Enterobacter phage vB_ExiM_F1M1E]UNA03097.1 hypothetical protein [Enterobacter phage vB_ExiM_F2M1E]UNA03418.1 hypothetical protein [Enterobacter phage vB_ExiM_F4M1E]UNA03739.1 hypothetical protein [Enterobacter phage vB_ExiM_F5M1E]UNA04059.1 hypothetical protein [Pantoea phage vB_PdiM_F5M2A]
MTPGSVTGYTLFIGSQQTKTNKERNKMSVIFLVSVFVAIASSTAICIKLGY